MVHAVNIHHVVGLQAALWREWSDVCLGMISRLNATMRQSSYSYLLKCRVCDFEKMELSTKMYLD